MDEQYCQAGFRRCFYCGRNGWDITKCKKPFPPEKVGEVMREIGARTDIRPDTTQHQPVANGAYREQTSDKAGESNEHGG